MKAKALIPIVIFFVGLIMFIYELITTIASFGILMMITAGVSSLVLKLTEKDRKRTKTLFLIAALSLLWGQVIALGLAILRDPRVPHVDIFLFPLNIIALGILLTVKWLQNKSSKRISEAKR